jgi:hypothetical protein
MEDKIKIIFELIERNIHKLDNNGLLHGKMGISLFLFHLGRKTNNRTYTEFAENVVEQVYESVENNSIAPDFGNGLAGIAWGLEHIIQSDFFEGDRDAILSDLDNKIFQYLMTKDDIPIRLQNGLLGYGVYLASRLQGKELTNSTDHNYLLKRVLIEVVNKMYDKCEEDETLLLEPSRFDIAWPLPLILLFLSELKKWNIYNHKIDIMLHSLATIALGISPMNPGNRLFLTIGLEETNHQLKKDEWKAQINSWKNGLNVGTLLNGFSSGNVFMNNGVAGVDFIGRLFHNSINSTLYEQLSNSIATRIVESIMWRKLEKKERNMSEYLGLFNGLSGVGLTLLSNNYDFFPSAKSVPKLYERINL